MLMPRYGWTSAPVKGQTKVQLEELAAFLDVPQSTVLQETVEQAYEHYIGDPAEAEREPQVRSQPEDRTPPEERLKPRSATADFNL